MSTFVPYEASVRWRGRSSLALERKRFDSDRRYRRPPPGDRHVGVAPWVRLEPDFAYPRCCGWPYLEEGVR